MAAAPRNDSSPASGPYVGPRPFEGHEANLYHGRTADARILCDRILSGRLTILYAQSGLGKSSLLRTRVIPMIEEQGTRAIYFDDWSQPDPLRTLRDVLAAFAAKMGIPDAASGSPTLTQLVRLISGANGLSVVLILDQFEEFLVRNADRLDPLRSELAALVRSSNADAVVLLSLREEYLAALEPFRQKIGNLFESAYRLEDLPETDLREAILEPPKLFGGRCEEALADRLIADLKTASANAAAGSRASFVGLTMLQLVCKELWKQATGGDHVLSLASYERLGGAQRIIDDYVSGLMPRRRRDRSLTAALLKHLAPRSGLKNPCSVEDLTDAHLKADAVEAELKRLSRAGILRPRDYNAGVVYELQHDAFIRVLREWRDGVLEHDRRRKRIFRFFAAASVLAVLFYSWARIEAAQARKEALLEAREEQKRLEMKAQSDQTIEAEHKKTQVLQDWLEGGLLDDLPADLVPSRFDTLATYWLWDKYKQDDPGSLGRLRAVLVGHEKLLPDSYGLRSAEAYQPPGTAPLAIEYPKSRQLDKAQFMVVWRDYAKELASSYGFPVPLKIDFKDTADGLAGEELAVSSESSPLIKVSAPTYNQQLLVRFTAAEVKNKRARDFLEHYVPIQSFPPDSRWTLIPRWSLPVWKAVKETENAGFTEVATNASGIAAYHVLTGLLSLDGRNSANRRAFLTPKAVEALLRNASRTYPAAVQEARAERGTCLAEDLSALVQQDPYALADLPLALDGLADQRCDAQTVSQGTPGRVQRSVTAQQNVPARTLQRDTSMSAPLLGPRPASPALFDVDPAFAGLEDSLPSSDQRFWVYGSRISSEEVQEIRDALYRKYGVAIPNPVFRDSDATNVPASVLRVKVNSAAEAKSVILAKAEESRKLWITPELVQDLEGHLPANTRDWIRKRYSLTSVKRLLGMVADKSTESEGGIRYPTWLLTSLCFWGTAEGGDAEASRMRDGAVMTEDLMQTQRARVHSITSQASPIHQIVENGVRELAADRVEAAAALFATAVQQNSRQARQAFLELWPQRLPALWIGTFRSHFDNLKDVNLEATERIDLQDLRADGLPDPATRRDLSVFRVAARLDVPGGRAASLQTLLDHAAPLEQWPLPEARWAAVEFLKQWDPSEPKTGNPRQFDTAVALLKRVVEKADQQQDAFDAFRDMIDLSQSVPGRPLQSRDIPNWSWPVLNELIAARPGGAPLNLPFELAFQLAEEEFPERLNRALALTDQYRNTLAAGGVDSTERARQEDLIAYARGRAYRHLGGQGDPRYLHEAEQEFRKVLASDWIKAERSDLAQSAYASLIEVLYYAGRASEGHALWEAALKNNGPGDSAAATASEMFGQIALGSLNGVSRPLRLAQRSASQADSQQLPIGVVLASILTQTGDWRGLAKRFLVKEQTNPYKDYVLLVFYAFDGGPKSAAASGLLADRWNEIHHGQGNWNARLKAGDSSVWREMVLSRFMGAPEMAPLLDTVDSEERWKQSNLAALPVTRRGLECEGWFYEAMRAKASGQTDRMRDCLRRAMAAGFKAYMEDSMARFILANSR